MPLHVGRGLCSDTQGPANGAVTIPHSSGKESRGSWAASAIKCSAWKWPLGARWWGRHVQSYPVFGRYRARTTERTVPITTAKVSLDLFGAVAPRTVCAGELARDHLLNVQIPEAPSQGSNWHQESALARALGDSDVLPPKTSIWKPLTLSTQPHLEHKRRCVHVLGVR